MTEYFLLSIISIRKSKRRGKRDHTNVRLLYLEACILFSRFSKSSKVSPDELLAFIEQLSKSSVTQPENTNSRPSVRFSKDGTLLSKE